MCGVDEVGILVVYLEDVEYHLPYEHGEGEYLAEDGMLAQLFGGGDVKGAADSQEQTPPLDVPEVVEEKGDGGHQYGHGQGADDQHGARNEGLLDGFVDEVEVEGADGMGNVGQQTEETLNLGGHPAQTLLLEVVLVADFLVVDVDVGFIADIHFLLEQEGFQLTVFTCCAELIDIVLKPLVVETHP